MNSLATEVEFSETRAKAFTQPRPLRAARLQWASLGSWAEYSTLFPNNQALGKVSAKQQKSLPF